MSEVEACNGEFATAVAAAAFAIAAIEDEQSLNREISSTGSEDSLTNMKTEEEKSKLKSTNPSTIPRWVSGKDAVEEDGKPIDGMTASDVSPPKPSKERPMVEEDSITEIQAPEKAPSFKKTPTFSDKYLNEPGSKKFENGRDQKAGPSASVIMKPVDGRRQEGNKMESREGQTKADAWEKAKLAKIQKRYDKMTTTILEWENEKKAKAKHQLEWKERAVGEKRARVLQENRDEMSRIDKIASQARAVADERRRNDEAKAIEKAQKIRSTGRIPKTCSCF